MIIVREVLELKEELKEHLIMSANEFINEGYEEQDAYEMAIKNLMVVLIC